MRKIKLATQKLTPSMKLAENITNGEGVTLMPSGIRLTPLFISRLEKWNIDSVFVMVDDPGREENAGGPASRQTAPAVSTPDKPTAALERQAFLDSVILDVDAWFSNVEDNPLMLQLRSIVIRKLAADGPKGRLREFRGSSGPPGGSDA